MIEKIKENWIASCLIILLGLFCLEEYCRVDVETGLLHSMQKLDSKVYYQLEYQKAALRMINIELKRHEELVNK